MQVIKEMFFCLVSYAAILGCVGRVITQQQSHDRDEKNSIQPRIISGGEVAEGAIPYQVSIQSTLGDNICGGAIISSRWILSAAHCMTWPKEYMKVITGTIKWKEPGAEYLVEKKIVHCSYNKPWMHNDIALVRTNKPIVFNKVTQPIALAKANTLKEGDKLRISGWGSTQVWGHPADTLHSVEVTFISHEKCSASVKKSDWLGEANICTDTTAGKGSCMNDSGGPLVHDNKVLVGVINWGEACAVGKPDVHASVANHYEWITKIMNGASAC